MNFGAGKMPKYRVLPCLYFHVISRNTRKHGQEKTPHQGTFRTVF